MLRAGWQARLTQRRVLRAEGVDGVDIQHIAQSELDSIVTFISWYRRTQTAVSIKMEECLSTMLFLKPFNGISQGVQRETPWRF